MSCRKIRSRFTAYLDGDLSPGAIRELERHVETCRSCERELEEVASFLETCQEVLVFPGAVYPFEALRARMATIEPLEEMVAFLPKLQVRGYVPRLVVAAVLMLLVGVTPSGLLKTRHTYTAMQSPFPQHQDQLQDLYEEFNLLEADEEAPSEDLNV